MSQPKKKYPKRGFASMDPARQREIASMGGKSIPPENRSYSKDRELAQRAGKKGGSVSRPETRTYSDLETAAECGSKGGLAVPAGKRTFSPQPQPVPRGRGSGP